MSFFKDFKEDLSQAVNELMPEEHISSKAMDPLMNDVMASDSDKLAGQDEDIAALLNQVDSFTTMEPDTFASSKANTATDQEAVKIDVIPSPSEEVAQNMGGMETQPVSSGNEESTGGSFMWNSSADPSQPLTGSGIAAEPQMAASGISSAALEYNPETLMKEQAMSAPKPEQYSAPQYSTPQYSAERPEPFYSSPTPNAQPEPPKAPEYAQERRPVEPVFKDSSYRPNPINTTGVKTGKETGVIITGMSVTGDIISDGNLEICGSVKGNIKLNGKLKISGSIEGNSDTEEVFADNAKITGDLKATGAVKIGQGTVVKGNVNATSAVIAGAIKGDIDIVGPVILDSTAIIMGNIKSKTLQINNGAVIEGLCSQCYAEVNPMSFFDKE